MYRIYICACVRTCVCLMKCLLCLPRGCFFREFVPWTVSSLVFSGDIQRETTYQTTYETGALSDPRSGRVGSGRVGSIRFGSGRFGSSRFGSVRFGSARLGLARVGSRSARVGSVRFGSVRFGSVRVGSGRVGSGCFQNSHGSGHPFPDPT